VRDISSPLIMSSRAKQTWLVSTAAVLALCACQRVPPATAVAPAQPPSSRAAPFRPERLAEIDSAIQEAIADKKCPGGVLWLEREGRVYHRAYGQRALVPAEEAATEDTIYDAASLTKVVATTPAVMLLVERGKVQLDATVHAYLPEFAGEGKESITIRQLLTHTSGLRPDVNLKPQWSGYETAIQLACAEKPRARPGATFVYSDINFFVLGEVVRRVAGCGLDEFVTREVYGPLKMLDTGFRPPAHLRSRIAPTEQDAEEGLLRGVVHDPTARRMGGVAGHAGLFTTAADLARFARFMLNEGQLDGVRLLRSETVRLMTAVQSPEAVAARRGLGWDIDSPYAGQRGEVFPLGGYGHTGWTGTSLWIDPFSRTFVIFLSNRNHPDEKGSVLALRHKLATLSAQALPDFNFAGVPGALPPRVKPEAGPPAAGRSLRTVEVLNGIDLLASNRFAVLQGLRVGLISNHTGHDRHRNATLDLLRSAPGVKLAALFSPEHGWRGVLDEKVGDSVDEATGLPVYSLYGETRRPKPEQLRDLDALVYDIQEVGCRFYTYISTLGLAMEAASQANVKFLVLDRVNPIGGARLEGPVYAGESSFTAYHSLPVRHGMTVGELAQMYRAERGLTCDLTVIPLEGWSRELWFDQTGLPWTNPSPNMRGLTEATLYPGVGLLETTALSVGRGTDTPFEVIGAPYIDDVLLAAELNRGGLAPVRFVPVRFRPTYSTFQGQTCGGAQIVLLDRERCAVLDLGILIAQTLHRLYPQHFDLDRFDRLLQHRPTVEAIRAGKSLAEIKQSWEADLAAFRKRREPFLLY
jgi:uncharacterized protein YbbC (DUF1343 family)/CubicO group peptidase (beta-lactamase class C family)